MIALESALHPVLVELDRLTALLERDTAGHVRWLDMTKIQRDSEESLTANLQSYFLGQLNRLLSRITSADVDVDSLLDWSEEGKRFREIIQAKYMAAWAYGYRFAREEASGIPESERNPSNVIYLREEYSEDYLITKAAIDAVNEALDELTEQISETTKDQIKGALKQGIEDGWSVKRIQEEIVKAFTIAGMDIGEYRALVIARTELIRALNTGARRAYEDSGFLKDPSAQFTATVRNAEGDEVKQYLLDAPPAHPMCRCTLSMNPIDGVLVWYTSLDERVCDICAPMDGQEAR